MATLESRLVDFGTRIATEFKSVRTAIAAVVTNVGTLSGLTTTAKSSLVAAINEVDADVAALSGSAAGINDATTSTSSTWSSTKTSNSINTAVSNLVGSAPGALDTIQELAAALGSADAVTNLTAAVGNRVRYDAAQSLTAPQQLQARDNIGAAASALFGNTDRDLVAVFEAALV